MSGPGRFLRGAAWLPRGAGTVLAGRGLLRWAVLPILASLFAFVILLAGAVWLAAHFAGQAGGGGWGTLWGWLAGVGAFLVVIVAGFFTFGMLAALVAAPFNEILSQATERLLTGSTGEVRDRSFAADMLRAALAAARLFALEVLAAALCLLLFLVPVAGAVLSPVLFAAQGAFFLALAFLDYPLDRRKLGVRGKLAFCRRHAAEVMGFGAAVYLVMMVPLLNVLMVPAAAAGATRLYLDAAGGGD